MVLNIFKKQNYSWSNIKFKVFVIAHAITLTNMLQNLIDIDKLSLIPLLVLFLLNIIALSCLFITTIIAMDFFYNALFKNKSIFAKKKKRK